MSSHKNNSFWPTYVDIMTTLFAIMLILFAVSFGRFKVKEKELLEFKDKYNEIKSIYTAVENIDTAYFRFDDKYVKHIFKLQVTYQKGKFDLNGGLQYDITNKKAAGELRTEIKHAGEEIQHTIETLQKNDSIKQDIKYLVVIEGQASKDGYYENEWKNNDVLSYQRALALHKFWKSKGIDFTKMPKCELVISGSGEGGVPRNVGNETSNQRFLIHIVPVIGNIRLSK